MYKHILGVLAVSTTLFLAPPTFAHFQCPVERLQKMVSTLDLNADQKKKVEAILVKMKENIKHEVGPIKDISHQLQEQVKSDHIDKNKLDHLIHEKTEIIGKMMKAKIYAKHQIRQVLSEKQRQTFNDMIAKKKAKIAEMYKKCDSED